MVDSIAYLGHMVDFEVFRLLRKICKQFESSNSSEGQWSRKPTQAGTMWLPYHTIEANLTTIVAPFTCHNCTYGRLHAKMDMPACCGYYDYSNNMASGMYQYMQLVGALVV